MIELPKYSNQELLESLQEYQKEIIQELLVNNNEDEAIELWINANGPINNVNFGGTQEKNQLLKNFKIELCKLLSESPEYEEQVKEIKGLVIENEFNNDIQEIIIKKPEDFLALPRCDEFDLIMNTTLLHLFNADVLSEEEEKNSYLDTNA